MGTKYEAEHVALTCLLNRFFPSSRTLRPSSAMPCTSSSVSVGSPIMKYIFIADQPSSKATVHEFITSCSVMFLLITSRIRCVPASGAMVKPVLRTLAISRASDSVTPDARRLETEKLTLRRSSSAPSIFTSGSRHV